MSVVLDGVAGGHVERMILTRVQVLVQTAKRMY